LSRIVRPAAVGEFPYTVHAPSLSSSDGEKELEDAHERARRILSEARLEADHMREEVEQELAGRRAALDSDIEQAVKKGREQGYTEGQDQARAEVVEQAREALAELRQMAEAFFAERERAWREQEREIVDMAVHVAEKVIRAHVEVERETIVRTTREAISRAAEKDQLVIRIHPEDVVILEEYVGDLHEEFRSLKQVQIEEDRRVTRGGCVVESRSGYIDATLESQIHQVRREFGLME
jgi:flagellar assembly protein FliH